MKSSSAAPSLKQEQVDDSILQEGGLSNLELRLGISSDNGMGGTGASNPWLGAGVHPWSLAARQEKAALEQAQQRPNECAVERENEAAAQLVGWPPVRAFRKKLSSSTPSPKAADAMKVRRCSSGEDGGELAGAGAGGDERRGSLLVKVNLQGYAVGRKVDLEAHRGYDELSRALQAMFQYPSFSDASREVDRKGSVSGSKYILLYEDDEGDRMLVGDVPWELFVASVKRLYIALA